MYLKLALRNAKRSVFDYVLYISTMVMLTSIICLSLCIANWGDMHAGFQTMALPLLIVIIMAVLANYINTYIVKQRAKEFATYMLLGMEKDKLSLLFLSELSFIGLICFLLGTALGIGMFSICCFSLLQGSGGQSIFPIMVKSIFQTFVYFGGVEILSIVLIKRKIYKLQIVQLMVEKQHNQPLGIKKKSFWGKIFFISFSCFIVLLFNISVMSNKIMSVSISLISIPMLLCVFSFYQWLFAHIASLRFSPTEVLYQGNRLYGVAEMTASSKTSANINTIFCVCVIFSALSFTFGMILIESDIHIFEQTQQQWMGFLQIMICVILMIIHFSIIALLQIIDLKREARNIRLLHYLGKNQSELKLLVRTQTLVRLFLPTVMSFIVLCAATPFINYKLNLIFPIFMRNLMIKAIGSFMLCFFALYLCYFCVIYTTSKHYMKLNSK